MNPSPEAQVEVESRSVEDVREAAQDSLTRLMLAVDILAVADDLPDDLTDALRQRIKIVSGAVNVLAARAT